MSSNVIVKYGNRKGHGIPPLRELKVKRLVCFWRAQWDELKELAYSEKLPRRKYHRNKHKAPKENIDFNILLADIPTEEPARNIWKLSSDEEHKWGDLTSEEELKLKKIIKS